MLLTNHKKKIIVLSFKGADKKQRSIALKPERPEPVSAEDWALIEASEKATNLLVKYDIQVTDDTVPAEPPKPKYRPRKKSAADDDDKITLGGDE